MLHVTQSESPTCLCRELGWYRDDPRPFVGGEFFIVYGKHTFTVTKTILKMFTVNKGVF